jgi:hypothetical protein
MQRFAVVAGPLEVAVPFQLHVEALLLAVPVGIVVLLAILHETALPLECGPETLLQERDDLRLLTGARLELLDDATACLPAMLSFGVVLRSRLVWLAIAHLLSRAV